MKIIGHRGARGLAPENTIASLKKAVQHGADGVEFDLRVTEDQVVVLHHDPYLIDPSGKKVVISQHSYQELKRHKADLATFEAALEAIGHKTKLFVEVKPDEPAKPVIKILKTCLTKDWKPWDFRLLSFSPDVLAELSQALPDIPIIVLEKWSGVRATRRARKLGATRIIMNQRWLWRGFIWSMKRGGWKLGAYTLNDPAKARRWQKWGLHSVVTDFPDRFERKS